MSQSRGQFSSRFGFILAASGSAIGLGNIWGFPTQTASNGGAAFVVAYFILAFALAYPALMAELTIGRYSRANIITALGGLSSSKTVNRTGSTVGYIAVIVASLILSFYTIVAGWMIAHLLEPLATAIGFNTFAEWLGTESYGRNIIVAAIFALTNMWIIARGIEDGIEKWSSRLMPMLLVLLVLLIGYVLTQPGAVEGLKVYLIPDWSLLANPTLIVNALGQAFFSMSLGVGTMLVYGSYLSKEENLPSIGVTVTLVDTSIAFVAGLLIIPAIYVAKELGTNVLTDSGELIGGPDLIFQVLPALFDSMGSASLLVSSAFFALMTIAAVTSSISMLEVPVSSLVEKTDISRTKASYIIGSVIFAISCVIIFNFSSLFGFVIDLTTKYSQPLLGVALCIYAGWVMSRDRLLTELKEGYPEVEKGIFWKIWPLYVRVFCPALILITFYHSIA